jgi:uncharacterized membrane protein YdjX (TVP38/TMEM64 family)
MVIMTQIERHENDLFYYLLFVRAVPMTPHWYCNDPRTLLSCVLGVHSGFLNARILNMAAPIAGVPFWPFFFSVLIGASSSS